MKRLRNWLSSFIFLLPGFGFAADGKLLATPGVSSIEGAGGGGLVPWSQLAGYATRDQIAVSGFCSRATVKDFSLTSCGVQSNWFDRLELSYTEQTLNVTPLSVDIEQNIWGAKVRLFGDIVYSRLPQLSIGMQSKSLLDKWVVGAFGAKESSSVDVYLAASHLHLAALAGYNVFWNVTLRNTEANQMGLLGFGSESHQRNFQVELSGAVFLNRQWATGFEYRQKPDNLGLVEDDWADIFIAWFPNKKMNLTVAYLDLGDIAGLRQQRGWYVSLMGHF